MPAVAPLTYQIKITLVETRPPVWRRLRVPASLTLGKLHSVIQTAFGWTDSHLHEFDIDGKRYGDGEDNINEARVPLRQVLSDGVTRFEYTYDFGDDWRHEIVVEKTEPGPKKVECLAGKRSGPPEDCGGPWGYAELQKVIANPNNPRHAELMEWLGDEFDPEDFSLATLNLLLSGQGA